MAAKQEKKKKSGSVVDADRQNIDTTIDSQLRPKNLKEFVGQTKLKKQLGIFLTAAKQRNEPLDHLLLVSPPGLGKTSLAHIIAHEMEATMRITSGPALERPGDAAAALTSLAANDIIFIDEIHRLHPAIEESLYSSLEDQRFDVVVGEGANNVSAISLPLERFTMIGATTRVGMLTSPLRDRFGIVLRLGFYPPEEMQDIVKRSAQLLALEASGEATFEIAKRSRGTPRLANRLLRRVRDYAEVCSNGKLSLTIVREALEMLEVDELGLDGTDKAYLESLLQRFNGGPTGLDTLAVSLGESPETLENYIEPYLIQQGYIQRTARGRIATALAYAWAKLDPPGQQNQELGVD